MKKRALFLDRDGTIIRDRWFISDTADVDLYTYSCSSLREVQKKFMLFIVTNQTGVGKGIISLEDSNRVNSYVVDMLKREKVIIEKIYSCPHVDDDNCICKKPKPHFLFDARDRYGIDLEKSYVIGDHPSDMELAVNAGARGLFVLTGHGRKHRRETDAMHRSFINLKYACRYALEN